MLNVTAPSGGVSGTLSLTGGRSPAGTGNIAGVATAIYLGGPGAVFWMWITAFVGCGGQDRAGGGRARIMRSRNVGPWLWADSITAPVTTTAFIGKADIRVRFAPSAHQISH